MGNMYVGIDNISRQISTAYIGVNGVARKIKQIFIGDSNGIARLVYVLKKGYSKLKSLYLGSSVKWEQLISHDSPYKDIYSIVKLKDNVFVIYVDTCTRTVNNDPNYRDTYHYVITDDDGNIQTFSTSPGTNIIHYQNGYYYFGPNGYVGGGSSGTSLYKSPLPAYSYDSQIGTHTEIIDPENDYPFTYEKHPIKGFCKLDSNTVAMFTTYSSASSSNIPLSYVFLIDETNGLIKKTYGNYHYLGPSLKYGKSKIYYVKDRCLVLPTDNQIWFMEFKSDYSGWTLTKTDIGTMSCNDKTYNCYDAKHVVYDGKDTFFFLYYESTGNYVWNDSLVAIPVRFNWDAKTAFAGTGKMFGDIGSISPVVFFQNETLTHFCEKGYGYHFALMAPYNRSANRFEDDYVYTTTLENGSSLTSPLRGNYDQYSGFLPIKDGENKLFVFYDTKEQLSSTGGNDSFQFYYQSGHVLIE